MTFDQTFLLSLLAIVLLLFVWGRFRHDIIAMMALLAITVAGQVSASDAFLGFANPATVTVALVLIISRGLTNTGAVTLIARRLLPQNDSKFVQISALSSIGGVLSSFMNNVGALGIMMPAAIKAGSEKKISPSLLLMPLAFGSILGGLVTLIGTPPNIIIAAFRAESTGQAFAMFDFAPVGLAVAIAGIAFIALIGWRLIPTGNGSRTTAEELFQLDNFITEVILPEEHALIGKSLRDADEMVRDQDAMIMGLVRGERRLDPATRRTLLREGDHLLIEAGPEAINATLTVLDLRPPPPAVEDDATGEPDQAAATAALQDGQEEEAVNQSEAEPEKKPAKKPLVGGSDVAVIEAVVQQGAKLIGRTRGQARLRSLYGINLLAVARQGRPYRGRIRDFRFRTGDVLLVEGEASRLTEIVMSLGCLPLSERPVAGAQVRMTWIALGLFLVAIAATTAGLLTFPIALALAVLAMVVINIVPPRELYDDIDWSVVVLLGAMLPLGQAMQQTGTTGLIADTLATGAAGLAPWFVLTIMLVITILLTNVINNAATAVVMAPVAMDLAESLSVNPDTFLMAVAIGASCAFLTPIGHQNNALIMGPGGYKFSDYWRMGLPLEFVIVAVAVPMLLIVWPL